MHDENKTLAFCIVSGNGTLYIPPRYLRNSDWII